MKNNHRFPLKLSQRDIAGILKIDTKTLYNWRKNKNELYTIVMLGFKFRELIAAQKSCYDELLRIESEVLAHTRLQSTPPPPPKKESSQNTESPAQTHKSKDERKH